MNKLPYSFGTYQLRGELLENAINQYFSVAKASQSIYKFDTAQLYQNERELTMLLSKHMSNPTQFHLTTKIRKITSTQATYQAILRSINHLRPFSLTVLLHRPMPIASWRALEQVKTEGLVKEIGVSNYGIRDLRNLLSEAKIRPSVNQIEFHPFMPGLAELVKFCHDQGIRVQAHTVLAKGEFLDDVKIMQVSQEVQRSPAQVMMRWALQSGADELILCTKKYDHLLEWGHIMDFKLSEDQMSRMAQEVTHIFYPQIWMGSQESQESNILEHHMTPDESTISNVVSQLRIDLSHVKSNSKKAKKKQELDNLLNRIGSSSTSSTQMGEPQNETKNGYISEMVTQIPKGMKSDNPYHVVLAQKIADQMFPLQLDQFDQNLQRAQHSQINLYRNMTRKLRHELHQQKNREALEQKKKKVKMCCLPRKKQISQEVAHPAPMPVEVAPGQELVPIFKWISTTSDTPQAALTFSRGTVFTDGRMDMCKQVVGNKYIGDLCQAVYGHALKKGFIKHFLLGNNIACEGDHEPSAESFAKLMRDHQISIETWYLAGNCIGPKCIKIISEALVGNPHAQALWLKRNPIMAEGASYLAQMLTQNDHLELLDLHNCGILDEGLMSFSQILVDHGQPVHLKHIYLDADGLTPKSMPIFSQYLKLNKNVLQSLYISINKLGDNGCLEVAKALAGSTSILRLCLASNMLSDSGLAQLVPYVMQMPALKYLDLGCYKSTFDMGESPNYLGMKDEAGTVQHLLNLLENHPSLEYVSILNNKLSHDSIKQISQKITSLNVNPQRKKNLSVDLAQFKKSTQILHDTTGKMKFGGSIQAHSVQTLRFIKHDPCVINIDSVYRNTM